MDVLTVSRRGFVAGAACAATTGALATMSAKAAETEVPQGWDY